MEHLNNTEIDRFIVTCFDEVTIRQRKLTQIHVSQGTKMFDKKQYITDSFLKAQKYWIEKQKSSKKKINAKMALLPFLMPNLNKNLVNIVGDESNWNMNDEETWLFLSQLTKEFEDFNKDNVIMTWKTRFQSIPSKSFEEYTVNDIREENVDFIIELQALEQLLKNKIMVTIQSKFKINNITLNSQLTLDIFNINDVKLLHNQILSLFPNGNHRLHVPLNINNKKHNINFIENKITDSKGDIVFHLKQVTDEDQYPLEQSSNNILFELNKNDNFLHKHKITKKDLENLLSKVELDILNHQTKTINQNQSLITVNSTYQNFIQLFQPNDYFVKSNNNLTDMYLAYIDLFHVEYITRYDLKKNWIQYLKPKKEYKFDSFRDCLHQYKKYLEYQYYQSSKQNPINKNKVFEDISNEEFCLKDLANYLSEHAKKDVFIDKHFLKMDSFKELNRISNNSGYLTKMYITKYFNKYKTILNRLKSFKHYVLLFNPDIKDIYYSSVLNNCYKVRDDNFNHMFNMLTIMKTCYPNLINNLMKYKQENAGLFPLIINSKLHDINNGVDDLLSFNKNKHLFDSKNQFKLLNKRKSSVLTKIYMALHINNSIHIGLNINDSFKICYVNHKHLKDKSNTKREPDFSQINMSHENYLLLTNIRTHVFWLLLSNRCFSIKQIHFMMQEMPLHLLMISFPFVKHFDNKTTQIIIKIIIQHWYQFLLNIAQKSKKEKIDWRTKYEKIIKNFKEFNELKRDYYTIHDFLGTLASSNTTIHEINKYINESKWKSYFNTNNYNEVVTRCLTEKFDDKFLLTIINKENDLFEFPLHKELKLNDKSTFKSLITYIQEYDKFYATQKHILDNQVCDYNNYPITIEKMQIGNITITPVSNSTELLYEGNTMKHCVYSYRDLCKDAEYVAFHITDNTEYNNIQDGQNVIKELTLGLSVFKNHYGSLTDIENSKHYQKFKKYRKISQDKKILERSPSHNNLYFAFNQCFGYKNDYIINDEQIANINLVINQLLYKLNCELLDSVGL